MSLQPSPAYTIKSHEALTRSLAKLGYFEEALDAAERAVELGSIDLTVRLRLAWLRARIGRVAEAVTEADSALSFSGSFPRPSDEHVRALCALGRTPEAAESAQNAAEQDARDLPAQCAAALLHVAEGRTEAAARLLTALVAHPDPRMSRFGVLGLEVLEVRAA